MLDAVFPKLVVLVEYEIDREANAESNTLDRLQFQLGELLLQVSQAPILRLNASEVDWNMEELVAAIHAM